MSFFVVDLSGVCRHTACWPNSPDPVCRGRALRARMAKVSPHFQSSSQEHMRTICFCFFFLHAKLCDKEQCDPLQESQIKVIHITVKDEWIYTCLFMLHIHIHEGSWWRYNSSFILPEVDLPLEWYLCWNRTHPASNYNKLRVWARFGFIKQWTERGGEGGARGGALSLIFFKTYKSSPSWRDDLRKSGLVQKGNNANKMFRLYTWKPFCRKKALLRKAGLNDLSRAV